MITKLRIVFHYMIINFKKQLEYRFDFIFSHFSDLILPLIIDGFLWISIYSSDNSFNYSLKEMLTYIIFSHILYVLTSCSVESRMESDIKSGNIVPKLLWPIHYLEDIFISTTISKSMNVLFYSFVVFSVTIVGQQFLEFNVNMSVIAGLLIISSILINLLLSMLIGIASFFITEIWGISAVKNLGLSLVTGTLFPLDILPEYFQRIMSYTPFPYMIYLPNKLLLSNQSLENDIFYQSAMYIVPVYVIGLAIIVTFIWKKGTSRYQTIGG